MQDGEAEGVTVDGSAVGSADGGAGVGPGGGAPDGGAPVVVGEGGAPAAAGEAVGPAGGATPEPGAVPDGAAPPAAGGAGGDTFPSAPEAPAAGPSPEPHAPAPAVGGVDPSPEGVEARARVIGGVVGACITCAGSLALGRPGTPLHALPVCGLPDRPPCTLARLIEAIGPLPVGGRPDLIALATPEWIAAHVRSEEPLP